MTYEPEPCLCGASDCRMCNPAGWRECDYDEDFAEEDRRDHDREDKEFLAEAEI